MKMPKRPTCEYLSIVWAKTMKFFGQRVQGLLFKVTNKVASLFFTKQTIDYVEINIKINGV